MSADKSAVTTARVADALAAGQRLAVSLRNPALLITLHRDIADAQWPDGRSLAGTSKQQALRWGIFTLTYGATEAFFNDVFIDAARTRPLPLHPDKLRAAGHKLGISLFTNEWGLRTRIPGGGAGRRSRWEKYVGSGAVREYLADTKSLRDLLAHGGDPYAATNTSGALWPLKRGNSMTLMGAEGFLQACCDLGSQTLLAHGATLNDLPLWPEPRRSGLSARDRPSLPLLP